MQSDKREETIRARAQEIWEREGKPDGRDLEIWYRAVEEFDTGRLQPDGREPSGSQQTQH